MFLFRTKDLVVVAVLLMVTSGFSFVAAGVDAVEASDDIVVINADIGAGTVADCIQTQEKVYSERSYYESTGAMVLVIGQGDILDNEMSCRYGGEMSMELMGFVGFDAVYADMGKEHQGMYSDNGVVVVSETPEKGFGIIERGNVSFGIAGSAQQIPPMDVEYVFTIGEYPVESSGPVVNIVSEITVISNGDVRQEEYSGEIRNDVFEDYLQTLILKHTTVSSTISDLVMLQRNLGLSVTIVTPTNASNKDEGSSFEDDETEEEPSENFEDDEETDYFVTAVTFDTPDDGDDMTTVTVLSVGTCNVSVDYEN